MTYYRFTIPIITPYAETKDEVHFAHLYFEGEKCPNEQQFFEALTKLAENEKKLFEKNPEYFYYSFLEYNEALKSAKKMERFPYLSGSLNSTNTFVDLPEIGKQPLTATIITVFKPAITHINRL
jgi:hypothetical protein